MVKYKEYSVINFIIGFGFDKVYVGVTNVAQLATLSSFSLPFLTFQDRSAIGPILTID